MSKPIYNLKIKKALDDAIPLALNNSLKYVERLLAQNQYHFKQIAYKNYPVDEKELMSHTNNYDLENMEDEEKAEKEKKLEQRKKEIELVLYKGVNPDIKYLFSFKGDIVFKGEKYVVNCLDWNPYNQDLLAGAYGPADIDSKKEGLLLFWTLKNQYPERVIKTPRGLTSCNFSTKNPYYIVVADYTGEILVYNLKNDSDVPIADSREVKDKHTDIVWEAKWIEKPNDKNEMIVSISSDGKVKEWLLKKGLEVTDLMHMKKNTTFPDKTLNPFSKYDQSTKDTLIFRDANGLSFDFPYNDTTVYYISLEECTVNKCRVSYKDTYIESYFGHQGPVYKVRCNPFDPNIFITCSYDWTIKIWTTKQVKPLLTCKSMNRSSQINDIEWSPFTSTIFGCVVDDGTIEIWDLAKQTIDPIISINLNGVPKKTIKFSRNSQVIATGDSEFNIDVFRLYNLEHAQVSLQDQIKRLEIILSQNSEGK
jgi:WD40 repeat protein